MSIDAAIRHLAFAESRTSHEALMAIAQHRTEVVRAFADAHRKAGSAHSSIETREETRLHDAAQQHRVDRKA